MYDQNMIYECVFVKRLNRFVATVILDGVEIDVHVKNTGRCKELLIPGSKGYLVKSINPKRKYAYDLVTIYKEQELVNFDSQLPNQVVADFIMSGNLFTNVVKVQREVTYNKSRFDVYVERLNEHNQIEKIFVEVKGVTLFENQHASFPDAPTERGTKHLGELIDSIDDGYKPYVFFLIQTENVMTFGPNKQIDPKFSQELGRAIENGVTVLAYNSYITPTEVRIKQAVELTF